jgi:hypothetical protein
VARYIKSKPCLLELNVNTVKVEGMSFARNALLGPKTLSQLLKAISLPHWSILEIEKTKEIL